MSEAVLYQAEPTASQFHQSRAFVRGLMGPIGSGKSVMCVEELKRLATQVQEPGPDGVRRSRFVVVRNSYPELKTTTIKTFQDWFPASICPLKWAAPITAQMVVADQGDGTGVNMEVFFLALDNDDDVRKLLSMELTAGWINEAREVAKSILDGLTGRVGRYPPKRLGGPSFPCVIMDTNPPSDDHWWYQAAEEDTPVNWQFFRQPAALLPQLRAGGELIWQNNPAAENISNLPTGYDYYRNQLGGKDRQWLRVYIEGCYGTVQQGRPVFPEYRDDVHLAETLALDRTVPLILGWDFGLTPACVIGQLSQRGQLSILVELVAEHMGLRQFVRDVVTPCLTTRFAGLPVGLSAADPSGVAGSQTDNESCIAVLNDEGIATRPAPTNHLEPRLQAVRDFLTKMVDGEPGFRLARDCRWLRRGFHGHYKFERIKASGSARFRDKPLKNSYSHPHDALQYLCLSASRVVTSLAVASDDRRAAYGYGHGHGSDGYSPATSAGY